MFPKIFKGGDEAKWTTLHFVHMMLYFVSSSVNLNGYFWHSACTLARYPGPHWCFSTFCLFRNGLKEGLLNEVPTLCDVFKGAKFQTVFLHKLSCLLQNVKAVFSVTVRGEVPWVEMCFWSKTLAMSLLWELSEMMVFMGPYPELNEMLLFSFLLHCRTLMTSSLHSSPLRWWSRWWLWGFSARSVTLETRGTAWTSS